MMQGDLIRHYGEHMVTAKVGAGALWPSPARKGQATGLLPAKKLGWGVLPLGSAGFRKRGLLSSPCQWSCLGWASTAAVGRDLGPGYPFSLCKVSYLRADPHPNPCLCIYIPAPRL